MKKLLLGTTLAAALTSGHLLADPGHQNHGQNKPCADANCPATANAGQQGQHGMGHGGMRESMRGRMQAMQGEHQGKGPHGMRGGRGPQGDKGKPGEGCPMQGGQKPA